MTRIDDAQSGPRLGTAMVSDPRQKRLGQRLARLRLAPSEELVQIVRLSPQRPVVGEFVRAVLTSGGMLMVYLRGPSGEMVVSTLPFFRAGPPLMARAGDLVAITRQGPYGPFPTVRILRRGPAWVPA